MKITVIGRKCTPRDSFKQRAEKRLEKVDKFFDGEAEAKITATAEKEKIVVEVTIFYGGMFFRAQERTYDDINEALDRCVDSIIRQIRKNRTKVEKRLRTEGFDQFSSAEQIEPEEQYELVRTKEIAVKPQSVDEAILQMNLLGHKFYMFINSADDRVSVVYVREDGGYGLLVPAEY